MATRSRSKKTVQPAEETRESPARMDEILRGAAEAFSKSGFSATSMREVARHTGASLGSIYYHFENKEAILHAIICGNFHRVIEAVETQLAGVEDPREALEKFVVNHISFFAQHLSEMRVMSHELDTLTGAAGEEEAGLRRAYAARARGILERLRPDLSSEDLRIATLSLFGMMNWTYRWYDTLPRGTRPEQLGRTMARLYLDGFLAGARGVTGARKGGAAKKAARRRR